MASDFRDDLFGDDFDDGFDDGGFDDASFDDDFGGIDDDLGGFDDEYDLGLDDDDDFGDFDEDFQDEFATTSGGGGGGPSPVFIGIAVLLIIVLLGGLGLIAYTLITRPPNPAEQTATAVVATNSAREILAAQTATQSKIVLDITMTAESFTDTPTPTPTSTDTPTPTEDTSAQQTADAQGTLDAADNLATETAIAATQTLGAQLNPPTLVPVASPTPIGSVPIDSAFVATISVGELSIGIGDFPSIDIDGTTAPLLEGTAIALVDGTPAAVLDTAPINPNIPIVQGTSVALINDEPVIVLESLPLSSFGIYVDIPPETSREIVNATAIAQIDSTPFIVIDSVSIAFGGPTATMPVGGEPVNISAVQMTATALANILETPTLVATTIADGGSGGGDATPTPEVIVDIGDLDGEDALPDTGLFDDVFGGNPMTIFLAAFGLLGVIMVSRRLRTENRKRK